MHQENKSKKKDNLVKDDIDKFKHYDKITEITPEIISDLKSLNNSLSWLISIKLN